MILKKYAYIFVRSGSKGLPNKNLKKISGKSLTERSLDFALKSNLFEKVFLSTDSREIIDLYRKKNIEIIPPKKIDGEVVSKIKIPKVDKKIEKKEKKLPPLPSVFQDIKPVKKVKPKYPIEAENKKIEGNVLAKLKVELDGTVSNVTILEANPINVFEEEVIQAAYKYLFRKDGTTYYAVQEFIFKIDP